MPLKSGSLMHRHMRPKLLAAVAAALALSALLLAGDARAQRAARQANDNASGGAKSKRVVGVRSSDTGSGSRVTITADDSLKDYSAYRSGDRFYVVLPRSAAGARGGGSGRGYSDMQVQQRGDSVVLSYRVQPGAKPRVEQKFNRLDVVFDVPGDAGQQATANNAARQQQQQQTPPAESRTPATQQNDRTQAAPAAPNTNAAAERRAQEEATRAEAARAEAARAQAANAANVNTTPPVATAAQPTASVDPAAQNPAATSAEPTQEPATTASPAAEPQIAQAQPPTTIAPITTNQPAANSAPAATLGTYLLQNWWIPLVLLVGVIGLGLVINTRRTTAPAPVEGLDDDSAVKLDESRASRAKEASAKALKDASASAHASTLSAAKTSTVSKAETVGATESAGAAEASDLKPLAAATALAGGAAAAKSRKQSRKEARQGTKRKKKGAHAEEPALTATVTEETAVAVPVAEETLVHEETVVETHSVEQTALAEETAVDERALVETPAAEEVVREEPAEVAEAVATEEVAEVVAEPEVAEHFAAPAVETAEPERLEVTGSGLETVTPASVTSAVETTEIAPAEAETFGPVVAEAEAPAPVTEIEPAFGPEPERVLAETRRLLEGGEYDRAVVGSRDAMARQMIAAELLSALAGRNAPKRERAGAAFVEHGYYEETARDLREADAPAERSAAARSLAILGDRKATPLLVAALEDPVSDVRRAAVEALGALRDPSAVEPLEALLERERNERTRIPPRVIRTAIEFCHEGFAQTPAAAEAAPVVVREEEAAAVEVAPVEEAAVETAPEPFADLPAPEAAEETSVSVQPFVGEVAETAHVPEPVHAEETLESVAETGVVPFVETARPSVEVEEDAAESREEFNTRAAAEVGIEPVAGQDEGLWTAETFDPATESRESGQAALFDAGADEATREIEPFAADSSKELTPSAGEWFDFDIGETGRESQPAASATATPEPVSESIFESSSGETLVSPAGTEVEETAPVAEARAEATRFIEVADEAAEPAPVLHEPEPAPFVHEPAAETREKGLAPFDESSTVPAAIQQRIKSSDAGERAAAIVELSHVDTDEAFQQICAAFDDPSREVRGAAARALHELRADRAESFTRALREATPERRREIGAAIASSGLAGESISQLTGESRERTYEAFSLLFLMAKAGEVQPLLRAIEGHPNNEVRLAVVKLLALSGQKEVLPAFRRLAVRGSLPTEVRSAVMEAIYQISSSQPTPA